MFKTLSVNETSKMSSSFPVSDQLRRVTLYFCDLSQIKKFVNVNFGSFLNSTDIFMFHGHEYIHSLPPLCPTYNLEDKIILHIFLNTPSLNIRNWKSLLCLHQTGKKICPLPFFSLTVQTSNAELMLKNFSMNQTIPVF